MYILSGDYKSKDPMDVDSMLGAYSRYKEYLNLHKHLLSTGAMSIAQRIVDGDPDDRLSVPGSVFKKMNLVDLLNENEWGVKLTFENAFRDRLLCFTYHGFSSFKILDGEGINVSPLDIYRSELRLADSGTGMLVHEFEWRNGARWVFKGRDIIFSEERVKN